MTILGLMAGSGRIPVAASLGRRELCSFQNYRLQHGQLQACGEHWAMEPRFIALPDVPSLAVAHPLWSTRLPSLNSHHSALHPERKKLSLHFQSANPQGRALIGPRQEVGHYDFSPLENLRGGKEVVGLQRGRSVPRSGR